MEMLWLKFAHLVGVVFLGGGLIAVFVLDLRSRHLRDLHLYAESIRNAVVFYDGLIIPGAILLLGSGTWLIVRYYGWGFLHIPWLATMVGLFAFEAIEGITVNRPHFTRLRRRTREAIEGGRVEEELRAAREQTLPTFRNFMDIPVLLVIAVMGALRPESWLPMLVGTAIAIGVGSFATALIVRLYPWTPTLPSTTGPQGGARVLRVAEEDAAGSL